MNATHHPAIQATGDGTTFRCPQCGRTFTQWHLRTETRRTRSGLSQDGAVVRHDCLSTGEPPINPECYERLSTLILLDIVCRMRETITRYGCESTMTSAQRHRLANCLIHAPVVEEVLEQRRRQGALFGSDTPAMDTGALAFVPVCKGLWNALRWVGEAIACTGLRDDAPPMDEEQQKAMQNALFWLRQTLEALEALEHRSEVAA